ncbi:MAG: peptidogalycan biosysnthesis protein, partial [Gammaproteobacteria bacterium]
MRAEFTEDIAAIDPVAWNRLSGTECPFLRHEFLAALESTGCVGRETGWHPCHVILRDAEGQLLGAMPLYRKTNSWGEFVFDFAWADAYRRAGLHYYPKLVSAVPYTPTTGPRTLFAAGQDESVIVQALLDAARRHARDLSLSSLHILFPTEPEVHEYDRLGLLIRKDCQFHWHNRGYREFDDFLGELTSVKRKKLRRERRRIAEAGIEFRVVSGGELEPMHWDTLMPLYASSFWRRGRPPYLNRA